MGKRGADRLLDGRIGGDIIRVGFRWFRWGYARDLIVSYEACQQPSHEILRLSLSLSLEDTRIATSPHCQRCVPG